MAAALPLLYVATTLVSTIVPALSKPKTPDAPTLTPPADIGREGAEAAQRESLRRRRRLALGRQGSITGAGSGLLNETAAAAPRAA